MAQKLKLKDIGMDSMEILYYERQAKRQKAYISRKRKKVKSANNPWMKKNSNTFSNTLKEAI
jgi:hypothetical protein